MPDLPAIPLTDDLVDRIAREIANEVAFHIETYYPDAARAVAWQSTKRSIQGVIRNQVASAGRATEAGLGEQWIKDCRRSRRKLRAMWAKAKVGIHGNDPQAEDDAAEDGPD